MAFTQPAVSPKTLCTTMSDIYTVGMTEAFISDLGGAKIRTVDMGNGRYMPFFTRTEVVEVKEINDALPGFEFRDDDVLLCSFPKTGTNWLYEIIMMVLKRSAERIPERKIKLMMEASTHAEMDKFSSPRVLNTHLHPRYLPKDVRNKQTKTVLVVRNPKDTAVSFYNHYAGMRKTCYDGKWEDWLPVYIAGKMEYGPYEEYLHGWESGLQHGLGFPLHVLYYEDMKEDGLSEVKKLADFLGVELDNELHERIVENCSFSKMAAGKITEEEKAVVFKTDFNLFRKGQVGDWKNWFTVAQNEAFDNSWTRRMAGYNMFNFRYQL